MASIRSVAGAAGAWREFVFAISADYERRTGGWIYNERLMRELETAGWRVQHLVLPAGFPYPSEEVRSRSAEAFARLPDDTLVVVDQLCLGVLPELARKEGRRLRLVMIVHHPLMLEQKGGSARDHFARAEREALRHVRLAIVTSRVTAAFLCESFEVPASKLLVAVPGTDRGTLSMGSGSGVPSLLSVGAIVPRKDHGTLIAALTKLRDAAWRLTIVGNTTRAPDHVAAIRRQIEAAKLGDRIVLAGELDDAALEEAWQKADLYVASSLHEGYGMAIAEAISRGLPVVTTEAGAVSEWLSRSASLMVPCGDAEALGRAIARVLDEPETRMALQRGAREERMRLPGWRDTAARVDAALAKLTAGQSPGRRSEQSQSA